MEIKDLKSGDKIYDIDFIQVKCYKYLCVHPTGRGKYHILIDPCQNPFRIYCDDLQKILDKNLNSYDEAKIALAEQLEDTARGLRANIKV